MKGYTRPCVSLSTSHGGRRHQRGASLVVMAVSLVALLSAVLAALDIGRLYTSQRSLQRQANMAALDAVRVISGCTGAETTNRAGLALSAAQQSLVRNFGDPGLLSATGFRYGSVLSGGSSGAAGLRSFVPSNSVANADAVQVELTRSMPVSLVRAFSKQPQGLMYAQAVAQNTDIIGLGIGTGLTGLNGGLVNNMMSALLGTTVSLTAVDYQGLLTARINSAGLMRAASINDLSALNDLGGTALLDAIRTVAGQNAPQSTQAVNTLLNGLAPILGPVQLGQVFSVPEDVSGSATQDVSIDAFNLLLGLTQAARANQGNLLSLSPVVVAPGVTATIGLRILEGPQFKAGRPGRDAGGNYFTQVSSSQVVVTVRLNVLGSALPLLTGVGFNGGITLDLSLSVAGGSAGLDSTRCARAGQSFHDIMVGAQSNIGRAAVGTIVGGASSLTQPTFSVQPSPLLNLSVSNNLLGLLLGGTTGVTVKAVSNLDVSPGTSTTLDFKVAATDVLPQVQSINAPLGASLNNVLTHLVQNLQVTVTPTSGNLLSGILSSATSLVLNTVLPAVVNTLAGLVGPLAANVLDPLLQALGVRFGTADVMITSISVDQPQLARITMRQ